MQKLNLADELKKGSQGFLEGVKNIYGQGLVSVILYGSASSGEHAGKHSNLNILVVLKSAELDDLKKAADLMRKFRQISPVFITKGQIASSTDIFPIEFLDMQENYLVLYGEDVLKDIHIDIRNLRFQCEYELKAKLISLKHAYVRIYKNKRLLKDLLFRSFTSVLHILRNILRIEGKKPPYQKPEIIKEVVSSLGLNQDVLGKVLAAKNKQTRLGDGEVNQLFIDFVKEAQKIVDIVDRL